MAQFLRFGALAAPQSIYSGIQQLQPGHLLSIQLPLNAEIPASRPWWCFRSLVEDSFAEPINDLRLGLEVLENVLNDAVQQQRLADVPLGSFLSGGIDSSLITALLQTQSSRPVRTFTIGFEEAGFNEAPCPCRGRPPRD